MVGNNYVQAMTLASKDSASLSGTYILLGTLPKAASQIVLINLSNISVFISYDGTNPSDIIPAGQRVPLSFQTNAVPT